MKRRLVLILGGARSGKSDYARELALERGGSKVLFVATAQAGDEEMRARIENHRSQRPRAWQVIESPRRVAGALAAYNPHVALLDCVTLWVSNVLLADGQAAESAMLLELDELLAWHRATETELIVVSNEVGMGVVPDNELGRAYRDLLGSVNRRLAAAADVVYLMVAGLPMQLKVDSGV
jgi:adenosyl cobinamide kinase/adenosyl cobinamide phosphate guanylyltransferase